jgi:hypothetical protein
MGQLGPRGMAGAVQAIGEVLAEMGLGTVQEQRDAA